MILLALRLKCNQFNSLFLNGPLAKILWLERGLGKEEHCWTLMWDSLVVETELTISFTTPHCQNLCTGKAGWQHAGNKWDEIHLVLHWFMQKHSPRCGVGEMKLTPWLLCQGSWHSPKGQEMHTHRKRTNIPEAIYGGNKWMLWEITFRRVGRCQCFSHIF